MSIGELGIRMIAILSIESHGRCSEVIYTIEPIERQLNCPLPKTRSI